MDSSSDDIVCVVGGDSFNLSCASERLNAIKPHDAFDALKLDALKESMDQVGLRLHQKENVSEQLSKTSDSIEHEIEVVRLPSPSKKLRVSPRKAYARKRHRYTRQRSRLADTMVSYLDVAEDVEEVSIEPSIDFDQTAWPNDESCEEEKCVVAWEESALDDLLLGDDSNDELVVVVDEGEENGEVSEEDGEVSVTQEEDESSMDEASFKETSSSVVEDGGSDFAFSAPSPVLEESRSESEELNHQEVAPIEEVAAAPIEKVVAAQTEQTEIVVAAQTEEVAETTAATTPTVTPAATPSKLAAFIRENVPTPPPLVASSRPSVVTVDRYAEFLRSNPPPCAAAPTATSPVAASPPSVVEAITPPASPVAAKAVTPPASPVAKAVTPPTSPVISPAPAISPPLPVASPRPLMPVVSAMPVVAQLSAPLVMPRVSAMPKIESPKVGPPLPPRKQRVVETIPQVPPRRRASDSDLLPCAPPQQRRGSESATSDLQLAQAHALYEELLTSEKTYVSDLAEVVEIRNRYLGESSEFDRVFSNVVCLHQTHETLLKKVCVDYERGLGSLESKARAWRVALEVLEEELKEKYTVYSTNYPSAISAYESAVKTSDAAVLKNSLIKPVQRLCKLPLFFKDLIFVSANSAVDELVCETKKCVDRICEHVNAREVVSRYQTGLDFLESLSNDRLPLKAEQLLEKFQCSFGREVVVFDNAVVVGLRSVGTGNVELNAAFEISSLEISRDKREVRLSGATLTVMEKRKSSSFRTRAKNFSLSPAQQQRVSSSPKSSCFVEFEAENQTSEFVAKLSSLVERAKAYIMPSTPSAMSPPPRAPRTTHRDTTPRSSSGKKRLSVTRFLGSAMRRASKGRQINF